MSHPGMVRDVIEYLRSTFSKLCFSEELVEREHVFIDRVDAGVKLAQLVRKCGVSERIDIVLAIPCGGVPVAYTLARELGKPFDMVIIRKILIPWNTEAGYGAVDPDGNYVLNEELRVYLGFSDEEVKSHVKATLKEIRRRERIFRGNRPYNHIRGKHVLLVDDGLASGYTMLVAVKFVKSKGARGVYVASPTASLSSIKLLHNLVDYLIILNVRLGIFGFAVADAYMVWYDVSDEEVLSYIEKARCK